MSIVDEEEKRIVIHENGLKIGRGPDNGLVLQEDYVSRSHCKILLKNDSFWL